MYLGIAVIGVFEFAVPNIGTAPDAWWKRLDGNFVKDCSFV
jgi:hypothetical protein